MLLFPSLSISSTLTFFLLETCYVPLKFFCQKSQVYMMNDYLSICLLETGGLDVRIRFLSTESIITCMIEWSFEFSFIRHVIAYISCKECNCVLHRIPLVWILSEGSCLEPIYGWMVFFVCLFFSWENFCLSNKNYGVYTLNGIFKRRLYRKENFKFSLPRLFFFFTVFPFF